MLNVGSEPVESKTGLVTSLAWEIDDAVQYVLEGNLNYSGAVVSWLKNDMGLIENASETESLAMKASKNDSVYLVPAFSGLGAPYWKEHARAGIALSIWDESVLDHISRKCYGMCMEEECAEKNI